MGERRVREADQADVLGDQMGLHRGQRLSLPGERRPAAAHTPGLRDEVDAGFGIGREAEQLAVIEERVRVPLSMLRLVEYLRPVATAHGRKELDPFPVPDSAAGRPIASATRRFDVAFSCAIQAVGAGNIGRR